VAPDRQAIGLRDEWRCWRCGYLRLAAALSSIHHRKLRKQGGRDAPSNLILLCGSGTTGCHGWVHAHPRDSRDKGWLVPSWADPAQRPVWHEHGQRWVLLDDDCGITPYLQDEEAR